MEETFRRIIENISDGIIAFDRNWQISYINISAEKILNRSSGSLVGKNIWSEFPEAVGKSFYNAYHTAANTQQITHIEDFSASRGKWLKADIYPSPEGLCVYFHDISAQKEAELKVQKRDYDYRLLLDRITDGFIALDKNFCYIYANQKIGELVQRDPRLLIGKNVWEEFPEAVNSVTYRAFHTAITEQRFISNIDYFEPLNLWQENYIYPSPEGLSVFIKDISEKKRLEKTLADQERRQHLQIISATIASQERERTFIGRELHDNVNQLLTATKLTLQFASEDLSSSSDLITSSINTIEKVISENRKLAHELVTPLFSDESFDEELSDVLESMLSPLGIKIITNLSGIAETQLTVEMKLAIYRIVQEQCTNIIKYSEATQVWVNLKIDERNFEMTITDNGKGGQQTEITKGIGLKNIEARLQLLDGSMHVTSIGGKGFTLNVKMPVQ